MAKKERKPKVRFKGFPQEWEPCNLGSITERVIRKNTNLESTLPLTISAQYGLVDQISFFNSQIASKDISNYYLLKNGEFAYNKSTSQDYPVGAVKRLDRYYMGVLSTLYILFRPKITVSSDYLVTYFDTDYWHKEITIRAAEGARNHGLLNISPNDFFDIELRKPKDIKEQDKIGVFLRKIDELIAQEQTKYEKLQNFKKSMLEKMFPKDGEDMPEIRFKGFSGAWKQRKLGEYGEFYYGHSAPKWSVTVDAETPCVRYGELYTRFGCKIDKVYSYTNMPKEKLVFSKGTEVLIPRVGEDPFDYNHCTWLSLAGVAIGEMISVYNTDQNPLFTAIMFNATLREEFATRVEGGSVTNLYYEKLKNINISFPRMEEQEKIATYLENLDNLITLHQRELEKLKNLKKALLERMFV